MQNSFAATAKKSPAIVLQYIIECSCIWHGQLTCVSFSPSGKRKSLAIDIQFMDKHCHNHAKDQRREGLKWLQ